MAGATPDIQLLPSLHRYQIILLGDTGTLCVNDWPRIAALKRSGPESNLRLVHKYSVTIKKIKTTRTDMHKHRKLRM